MRKQIMGLSALVSLLVGTAQADPTVWQHEWPKTDFSQSAVPFDEILSGGPPKDGIPAISDPTFIPVLDEALIAPREPVIAVELGGVTPRAYPVRYLTWHEIINDTVGTTPIAVTFCPLCNSAITFDRRLEGDVITLGVSGKLRRSDMVMYDRETESWWQQAIGEAIVGERTGKVLTQLPTWMESWEEFRTRNPEGLVMAEPAWNRDYGRNPYLRYDSSARPFLYSGEMPPHDVPALARVIRVGDKAWPLERLRLVEELVEEGLTITWKRGKASALDAARIADGKNVGSIRVRDARGADVPHDVMFAFAYHAFWPDGTWMLGE